MRHKKAVKKLGRDAEHRRALLRNQVISLFREGKIKTTLAKAKETRRWAEKLITIAKKGKEDFNARRLVNRFLAERKETNYLFEVVAPLFEGREGGYTRIIKLGTRRGDGAQMAILELLEKPEKQSTKGKKEEKK